MSSWMVIVDSSASSDADDGADDEDVVGHAKREDVIASPASSQLVV